MEEISREYYLSGLAALLYVALRLQGEDAVFEGAERWLLAGPAGWARQARIAVLPLGILLAGAVYPFLALLRSGQEAHLFFLAGAAVLLPYAFFRGGHGSTYAAPLCALLLGGALYLFAKNELGPVGSLVLIAAAPLLLLNVLAFEVGPLDFLKRAGGPSGETVRERIPSSSL